MNRNSVTIRNMFMKLSRNVYEVKTMFGIQLFLFPVSSFLSYSPLIVFYVVLFCNLHSCTPHKSLTVHDIFIQFNRNVY